MSKYTIDIYTTDDNYTRITRNNRDSFTQNITVSLPITKIVITNKRTSGSGSEMCPVQLLKPAITDEGTLWINNGVEPLEVYARDNNAQYLKEPIKCFMLPLRHLSSPPYFYGRLRQWHLQRHGGESRVPPSWS